MNKATNLYAVIVLGFLSFILFTIFENNQYIFQIFNSFNSNYFKEVVAGKENEEDSIEQKICNKLFEPETCEKGKEDKPIEKEELTEEEIKEEANRQLIQEYHRYLISIDTSTNFKKDISSYI